MIYIGTLESLIEVLEAEDQNRSVRLGFTAPHSYRGYYDEVAFVPVVGAKASVGTMAEAARSALGATFTGWKGGEYTMYSHTPCWLAHQGDLGEILGPIMLALMLGYHPFHFMGVIAE